MASLARGEDEQVVEDFYWYLLHSTAAHAFPEGIYYKRRFAWSDTIPHVTGAANYAFMLRHMLIHERGDELHLLAAVPDGWLAEGKEIRDREGPDALRPDGPARPRHGGRRRDRAQAAGPHAAEADRPSPARVAAPGQSAAGRRRREAAGAEEDLGLRRRGAALPEGRRPLSRPIPGLVQLPLAAPPVARALPNRSTWRPWPIPIRSRPRSACPTRASSSSPGCPWGGRSWRACRSRSSTRPRTAAAGWWCSIRPARPKDRTWPTQVEIPVRAQGKRLFFLGNVTGWAPADDGTGPWGAVAEYVIRYADGQRQIVPLVTGRTADDWIGAARGRGGRGGPAGRPVAPERPGRRSAAGRRWRRSSSATWARRQRRCSSR